MQSLVGQAGIHNYTYPTYKYILLAHQHRHTSRKSEKKKKRKKIFLFFSYIIDCSPIVPLS